MYLSANRNSVVKALCITHFVECFHAELLSVIRTTVSDDSKCWNQRASAKLVSDDYILDTSYQNNSVRNGFPCNKNAKIHWQLPVFTEQISFRLICLLSGHCSDTQRHLRRCEVSTERWQLGVCIQPKTKQHFGRHSKIPAHFHVQWKLEYWRSEGQLCQWRLLKTGFEVMAILRYIAKVLKGQASPLDQFFKL